MRRGLRSLRERRDGRGLFKMHLPLTEEMFLLVIPSLSTRGLFLIAYPLKRLYNRT